jgi:hypothetical protein
MLNKQLPNYATAFRDCPIEALVREPRKRCTFDGWATTLYVGDPRLSHPNAYLPVPKAGSTIVRGVLAAAWNFTLREGQRCTPRAVFEEELHLAPPHLRPGFQSDPPRFLANGSVCWLVHGGVLVKAQRPRGTVRSGEHPPLA